jgi:hypothetical protein
MRLTPSDAEPELWVNPNWQEGTPGMFAVVMGVSYYPHLEGSETPADTLDEPWIREARRLGQLQVSALTAFEFFCWLRQHYRLGSAPLARVWLLLSPTEKERVHTSDITTHLTLPTFDNCRKVLRFWHQAMQQLPLAAKKASRVLFFFSGHGLEVHPEHQILLPCDYLAPPSPSCNDAISTQTSSACLSRWCARSWTHPLRQPLLHSSSCVQTGSISCMIGYAILPTGLMSGQTAQRSGLSRSCGSSYGRLMRRLPRRPSIWGF